tara:strand:+ start:132 stop:359 length:228 start_codon:yes stop_codon:yes gene_type:complete
MVWLYLVVAFIIFFIQWKRLSTEMLRKVGGLEGVYDWSSTKEFWEILVTSLCWCFAVPARILWFLMNKVWDKFNK